MVEGAALEMPRGEKIVSVGSNPTLSVPQFSQGFDPKITRTASDSKNGTKRENGTKRARTSNYDRINYFDWLGINPD